MRKEEEKTRKLVMGAMMMCLIIVMTMIFKIPVPFTQGYVHLGDGMIFLSVMILGRKYGAVCSGVGSALADLFCGMAMWAPWSLVIKFLMAFVMGTILSGKEITRPREVTAIAAGGILMVAGYFLAETVMYGSMSIAVIGIPWNIGQFLIGGIMSVALSTALSRTKAASVFEYTLKG